MNSTQPFLNPATTLVNTIAPSGIFKLRFKALGSPCEIQFGCNSAETAKAYRSSALKWLRDFESTWSRFRSNSLTTRINNSAGKRPVFIQPKNRHIIELCDYVFKASTGIIDPTSYALNRIWDHAAKIQCLPCDDEIKKALALVSWNKVEFDGEHLFLPDPTMAFEIGGFGKEYAADQLIEIARQHGITSALVDLGRDIATLGKPPHRECWIGGIEDAKNLEQTLHRGILDGKALATSGSGRRYREIAGQNFSHIVDPRTGYPVENSTLSASALAPSCLTAGLLATTACILGQTEAIQTAEHLLNADLILQTETQTLFSFRAHQSILAS